MWFLSDRCCSAGGPRLRTRETMDQALKQRLIGAIILIALAVIFVPMLLDEPVSEADSPSLEIPPRPQAPVHTRRIPAQPGEAGDSLTAQNDNSAIADNGSRDDDLGLAARRPTRDHDVNAEDLYSPEAYLGGSEPAQGDDANSADARKSRESKNDYATNNSRFDPTGLGSVTPAPQRRDPAPRDTSPAQPQSNTTRADSKKLASTTEAGSETSRATESDPHSSETIIRNSPPVAANPAASLITPNDSNGSGLIPDNQWALQVASFSTTENASRLARQLREMGYNPNLDTIYRGGAALHRVRVGPFNNRQAAAAAGERIAGEIQGLRPSPVAPRVGDTPERATASTTPAAKSSSTSAATSNTNRASSQSAPAPAKPAKPDDGLDRYAVQLGVFSAPDNADRLQTRVREAGYSAFVERVDGANGTRFLVKVGPLLSRNDASATRDRIERELGMKGILVDYF